jgi:hypothetical protein
LASLTGILEMTFGWFAPFSGESVFGCAGSGDLPFRARVYEEPRFSPAIASTRRANRRGRSNRLVTGVLLVSATLLWLYFSGRVRNPWRRPGDDQKERTV